MDILTSPSRAVNEETGSTADEKDKGTTDSGLHETSSSDQNPVLVSTSGQDQISEPQKENGEDSATDCDSLATSSISNRFTALSEEQHSQDSMQCDQTSDMELEEEDDTVLIDKMEKVDLNEAFIEDSDALDPDVERENKTLEAKEYTVTNQDPELAFNTLAARTVPEKQECSVQSCLFHFTEVETLTQNNSLLCVTCTKQQLGKNQVEGTKNYSWLKNIQ